MATYRITGINPIHTYGILIAESGNEVGNGISGRTVLAQAQAEADRLQETLTVYDMDSEDEITVQPHEQ